MSVDLLPCPKPDKYPHCPGHDPAHCPGHNRARNPCPQRAGHGTTHLGYGLCKYHGGASPGGDKHAQAVEVETDRVLAARKLGVPDGIDPTQALIEALAMARNDVLFYGTRVGLITDDSKLTQTDKAGLSRPAAIVVLYRDSLKEYARQAAQAVHLGIEAAAVSVVQAQGEQLIRFTRLLLERLGVDPAAPETIELVQSVVRTIETDAA